MVFGEHGVDRREFAINVQPSTSGLANASGDVWQIKFSLDAVPMGAWVNGDGLDSFGRHAWPSATSLAIADLCVVLFHEMLHVARVDIHETHNDRLGLQGCDRVYLIANTFQYLLWSRIDRYCSMPTVRDPTSEAGNNQANEGEWGRAAGVNLRLRIRSEILRPQILGEKSNVQTMQPVIRGAAILVALSACGAPAPDASTPLEEARSPRLRWCTDLYPDPLWDPSDIPGVVVRAEGVLDARCPTAGTLIDTGEGQAFYSVYVEYPDGRVKGVVPQLRKGLEVIYAFAPPDMWGEPAAHGSILSDEGDFTALGHADGSLISQAVRGLTATLGPPSRRGVTVDTDCSLRHAPLQVAYRGDLASIPPGSTVELADGALRVMNVRSLVAVGCEAYADMADESVDVVIWRRKPVR